MADLQSRIEELWERRDEWDAGDDEARATVTEAIDALDRGEVRVAEIDEVTRDVTVNLWLKYAILLLFRLSEMKTIEVGPFTYVDKIPLKRDFTGVRVVPGASARWGSYLEPGVILMPSYVNIGARVGSGTLVDTWATVASCAQIGRNVHLSGGVGIGGVLEPPQAAPVIVEDDCFIGSRCMIVDGVCVGRSRSSPPASSCRARSRSSTPRPVSKSAAATSRRTAWSCKPPVPGPSPVASSGCPAR